mmetsp:Transcript_391/g.1031  ORF Transcript_391/g.1031 Transcript_391/m.1031 type:complete len:210 (-) Transcript_391:54-683(-)
MKGTDPGIAFIANKLAMAIMAARPFFFSTVLYRATLSSGSFLDRPIQSKPMSPGIFLETPRKLSPACETPSPSAIAMKARIAPKLPGSSRAQTPRPVVQSSASGAPGKCHPRPSVVQTPVQASMAMRPCLISASSRNCVCGNMFGNAPSISCILPKPIGSKTSPLNSGLKDGSCIPYRSRAVDALPVWAGAKAAHDPIRAAAITDFIVG